eukprot:TRINITY_DN3366_c0_g1_i11.p2 TRINITY_DN3366_c0_g1~~TRINITY_DN3366_c0_g1_i11.p2  ORF type:complete len:144 (-),score=8.22 TRINITY_DN3366_c0_g1_i11:378-809(-)
MIYPPSNKIQGDASSEPEDRATLMQIPVAILAYGAMSASIYIFLGTTCYLFKPSRFVGNFIQRFPAIQNYAQKIYSTRQLKAVTGFQWMSKFKNFQKITVAIAESLTISTISKPVVVPVKLWIAWNVAKKFQQNQLQTKTILQ